MRHVRVAVAVLHVAGEVVPLLDLAQDDLGRRQLALAEAVEDVVDVVRLDPAQHQQRAAGHPDVDERLLGAEAEAADRRQLHGEAAGVDLGREGVVDRLGAVAGAAGAHADGDARLAREQLGEAGLAHGGERGDVLDLHRALSLRSSSTSRISACSLTWPTDRVVDLDHRGERALAEAGDGADREAPVRRRERELVGAVGGLVQAQLELHALEQRPRAAGVAGRAAADGHRVRALRLEVEQREERRHAVDLRLGDARPRRPRTRASPSAGTCGGGGPAASRGCRAARRGGRPGRR